MDNPLHAPLVLVLALTGLLAFFLLSLALMPGRTRHACTTLEAHPWRSLGLGLATALLLLLLLKTLSEHLPEKLKVLAIPLAACGLLFPVGLGVASEFVGRRLLGAPDRRMACLLLGGSVTCLASAIPLLGWFAILPLAALSGGGALLADAVRPDAK